MVLSPELEVRYVIGYWINLYLSGSLSAELCQRLILLQEKDQKLSSFFPCRDTQIKPFIANHALFLHLSRELKERGEEKKILRKKGEKESV